MSARCWIVAGSVLAAAAVAAGAFGAHGLRQPLPSGPVSVEQLAAYERAAATLAVFDTAARYQMYHAIGLVLTGLLAVAGPRLTVVGDGCEFGGSLLFAGHHLLLRLALCRRASSDHTTAAAAGAAWRVAVHGWLAGSRRRGTFAAQRIERGQISVGPAAPAIETKTAQKAVLRRATHVPVERLSEPSESSNSTGYNAAAGRNFTAKASRSSHQACHGRRLSCAKQ